MTEPIDKATLELLLPLVAGLQSGDLMVTKLDASDADTSKQTVAIMWCDRHPEDATPEAPAGTPPVFVAGRCRACGAQAHELESGAWLCDDCGEEWG